MPAQDQDDTSQVSIDGCQGHDQLKGDTDLVGELLRWHHRQEELHEE